MLQLTPGDSTAILPVALPAEARLAVVAAPAPHQADRHPALVYLAALAAGSRRTMRQALDVIAGLLTGGRATHLTLPWHHLEYAHTAAVRAALAEHYAPASANKMLAALRGVLTEAWRLGYMPAEARARAADLKPVRGDNTIPAGRELTAGELRALLEACAADPSPAGVRDGAIFALCYGAGLRRAEAVRADVAHVDPQTGDVRVRGKGQKWRVTYARGGAADVLRAWLRVRGDAPGRRLLPVSQTGAIIATRRLPGGAEAPASLSERAVYLRLKARALEAGVKPFSPHDCRRTYAGDLLDAGADLNTVKELLGHANVQTTSKYDRRGERVKRDAADLLHFPHVRFSA